MTGLMMRTVGLLALILACAVVAFGDSPKTLNYQGYLTDPSGNPLPSNNYSLTFRIYKAPSGGSSLWTESQTVGVINGIFSVILGKTSPIGLAFDTTYYMGIQVGADPEMTPRIEMTSVAYSFSARSAKPTGPAGGDLAGTYPNPTVADGAITAAKLSPGLSVPPSGTASGDLTGSFPGPTIANDAVTSAKIDDGAIVNADISASAAIAASKVFGLTGIEYSAWGSAFYKIEANDATVHVLGNMAISAPTSGHVVVILSGVVSFMGDGKTIQIGINTVNTALVENYSTNTGRSDGTGTLRFYDPFTAIAAFPVDAGTVMIYALAQGSSIFDAGVANVVPQMMVGLFVPKRY